MIHLGADHRGFKAKENLKKYFDKQGIKYTDHGASTLDPKDDYPDYAHKVAQAVAKDRKARGIIICGSGFGVAITANKTKNIRATVLYSPAQAYIARQHNDINVACLSTMFQKQKDHTKIIDTFLNTRFAGGRHLRRLKKIEK